MAAGVVPGLEVTEPLATKLVEPMVEAAPTLKQNQVSEVSVTDKIKGAFIPTLKEKHVPIVKPKGDCHWFYFCRCT